MKKGIFLLLILFAFSYTVTLAEKVDISSFSLEELTSLDSEIHSRISELEAKASSLEVPATSDVDDWLAYYQSNGIAVNGVEAATLRKDRDTYAGNKIYTVLYVEEVDENKLRCFTESGKSIYDAIAYFADPSEILQLKSGNIIAVIGEVEESSLLDFGDLYMKDCHILATGETAQKYLQDIKAATTQRNALETEKNKAEYASSCSEVQSSDYASIERNPDSYTGLRMSLSGTVLSVSEDWFDTTTILVKDKNKHIWNVEYSRPDGAMRILENDKITLYGECTGVETSFTALLYDADSDTIPSIKAVYIDIN